MTTGDGEVVDAPAPDGGTQQSSPEGPGPRRWAWVVAGLFVASRVVVQLAGVRFTTFTSGDLAQLDPSALAADPFVAFTSNHVQPPLWNFFIGAVERWSPFPVVGTFQVLFLLVGLGTVLVLWALLVELGSRPWVATVAATLVGWSPVMIRYEYLLRYEAPLAAIVTLSAWCLMRWLRRRSTRWLIAFAACLVIGVLTRTTLSPLWLLGALVPIVIARWRSPARWRTVGIVAAAVALVAFPLAHRYQAYGVVGLSSYGGMNLARTATVQLPAHELDALIARGRVSPAATVVPYAPYREYAPWSEPCEAATGEPVLDRYVKTDGTTNLNNVCYIAVGRQAARDALAAIRADPGVYASTVWRSALLYASFEAPGPLDAGMPGAAGSGFMAGWFTAYAPVMVPVHIGHSWSGADPQPSLSMLEHLYGPVLDETDLSLTVVAGLLVAVGLGLRGVLRWRRGRADPADVTRIYIGFTVVVVSAVSILADTFENARFRIPLDPLVLGPLYALVIAGVVGGARRITARATSHGLS